MSEENINEEPTQDEQQGEAGADAQLAAEIAALDAEESAADNAEKVADAVDAAASEAPVVEAVAEVEVAPRNIKVAINSLEFRPRGKAGFYRAGGAYVLEAKEALELVSAGIATLIEDPCDKALTFPDLDPVDEVE